MSNDGSSKNVAEDEELVVPDWVRDASRLTVFLRGMWCALYVPGWILLVSAAGFGVLAKDSGLSFLQSIFVMVVYFGLPAQIAVADEFARGASFWGCAIAVALTGVRLLPMTISFLPYLGPVHGEGNFGLQRVTAVHFLAVTAWFEGMRFLPRIPERLRTLYFLGIGAGLLGMSVVGTVVGYLLVGAVPPLIGAIFLFVSPAYFLLALVDAARLRADFLAIALGCAFAPVFYLLLPDFDLLVTGVLGGTLAYLLGRGDRGLPYVPIFGGVRRRFKGGRDG